MTDAFEHIPTTRQAGVFIFGDHASRHIPKAYENLGLSGDDLTRHIAWDIGTEQIVRRLCHHFKCAGQLAGVSRLLIDLNRDLDSDSLIPGTSDESVIPGNLNLSSAQRQNRIDQFYTPYHTELGAQLDQLDDPLVLSIHSFTPQPRAGARRMTDIGLLVKHDTETAARFKQGFEALDQGFNIGMNKPYSAYDLNYTVDAHVAPRRLRHLAIEIRQDLVETEAGIAKISNLMADRLEPLIDRAHIPKSAE